MKLWTPRVTAMSYLRKVITQRKPRRWVRKVIDLVSRENERYFWNCNGFRDPKKHRFVADSIREQNLCFIAISEMGRKGFNDSTLRNLFEGRNFLCHCKDLRDLRSYIVKFKRTILRNQVISSLV
jgi:hypothetical protein